MAPAETTCPAIKTNPTTKTPIQPNPVRPFLVIPPRAVTKASPAMRNRPEAMMPTDASRVRAFRDWLVTNIFSRFDRSLNHHPKASQPIKQTSPWVQTMLTRVPSGRRSMVVVYGTLCLDRIRRIDALPEPGGYAEIEAEMWAVGGEAANTAFMLNQLGAEFWLATNPIANDQPGRFLIDEILQAGIDMDHIAVSIRQTPVCDIYVTPDGDRTMFGLGFLEMRDQEDHISYPIEPGSWITIEQNHGPLARKVAVDAQAAGMRCYVLDFVQADEPSLNGGIWQTSTDWKGERAYLDQNIAVVRDIAAGGATAILTDGPHPFAVALPNGFSTLLTPFPAPRVVDTTGAGDAFRGSMLFGLDQAWTLGRCLAFASAAGSLSCGVMGGTVCPPLLEEIEELIQLHPEIAAEYSRAELAFRV